MSSIKQQLDAAIQEGHLTAPRDYTPGARRKETEMSQPIKAEKRGGQKHCAPTLPCGCAIQRGPLVTLCDLHGAAPELAEALQALLRAERDVVYDRAAIQRAKDALKKAGY